MLENNSSFKIHNKFELKLYDQDGNLKQEAFGYNEANSEKYTMTSLGTYSSIGYAPTSFAYIALGSGDPLTFTPSQNNYKLNTFKFRQPVSFKRISPFKREYETIEYQSDDVIFPPTLDYVAQLTEIGISGNDYTVGAYTDNKMRMYLYSHAYIVDAAGNPIVINKTEYDSLKIQATIHITPILKSSDKDLNFKFFPAYSTTLGGAQTSTNKIALFTSIFPSARGGLSYYFSPQYVPESSDGLIYDNPMAVTETDAITTSLTEHGQIVYDEKAGTQDFVNCFPLQFSSVNNLTTPSQKNFGFAHSIIFPSLGAISLPNKKILPEYTIKDIALGTGDGNNCYFYTSINELALDDNNLPKLVVYIQNSEEETKKIVDPAEYEFINFDIKKSPLWNKLLYVEDYFSKAKYEKNSFQIVDNVICNTGICALTNYAFPVVTVPTGGSYATRDTLNFFAPNQRFRTVFYDENGITIDEARIGIGFYSYYANYSTGYSYLSPTLKLLYKNNEEEDWQIITIPKADPNEFLVTKFEAVTAKYWALQTGNYGNNTDSYSYPTFQGSKRLMSYSPKDTFTNQIYGYDPNYIVVGNSAEYDFSKIGLNFKTPPPEGAIITMDATLDLPYKTPDGSMTFSYQATLNAPTSS